MCGIYNLGFLGLRLDGRTSGFLDWWCDRLDRYCFVDLANGMFVDQSWMDFAPAYLESVAIMRDPIYNIAYWNLPHRFPVLQDGHWEIDGRRVGFFHFSGVDLQDIDQISRHQDRIELASRPELRPLVEHYTDLVRRSGQHDLRSVPYAYGCFSGTDVSIPADARRALHEVDPSGARWPDPFDVECEDSFLSWLATPIHLDGGVANRAALYLWQYNDNLQAEFPRIDDRDLPRFSQWFVSGGSAEHDLDDIFVDPLRAHLSASLFHDGWKRIRGITLSAPGAEAHWLNKPVDSEMDPVLTRLATAIYDARPDLQARFPDPLGGDRGQFAYWLVRFGSSDYGLHPCLVEPIARALPPRSRLSVWLRNALAGGDRLEAKPRLLQPYVRQATVASSAVRLDDGRVFSSRTPVGVNLVGHFEGTDGVASFASGIRDVLVDAEIPHVVVPLDHDLPDIMTTARIRFESGAPYPVTLLALPTPQWNPAIRKLPVGCRAGGIIVGYCCDPVEAVRATEMTGVDEVWVRNAPGGPSNRSHVPGPCPSGDARRRTTREGRGASPVSISTAIAPGSSQSTSDEARKTISPFRGRSNVRQLHRDRPTPVGLLLVVGTVRSSLASELHHLPVRVHEGPITADVVREGLEACDVLLDLSRFPRLGPIGVEAALSGKVRVTGRWLELPEAASAASESHDILIESGEASSEVIVNAVAAMREIVRERASASVKPVDEKDRAAREAWRREAVDQWRREILRVFNRGM